MSGLSFLFYDEFDGVRRRRVEGCFVVDVLGRSDKNNLANLEMNGAGGSDRGGGGSSSPDEEDEKDEEHPDQNTNTAAQDERDGSSLPRSKLVQSAMETEDELVMRTMVLTIDTLSFLPEERMMLNRDLLMVRPQLGHICRANRRKGNAMRLPVERRQAEEFPGLIGKAVHLGPEAAARVGRRALSPGSERNGGSLSSSMADSNGTEGVGVSDLDVGSGFGADSMAAVGREDDDANRSGRGEPEGAGDDQCRDLHLEDSD